MDFYTDLYYAINCTTNLPAAITSSLDKITWTNNDLQPHTVTSGENAEAGDRFDSGMMAPTRTYEHTFTQPSQHPYPCILNPNMVGTVRVID